jgi:hypothetical protein
MSKATVFRSPRLPQQLSDQPQSVARIDLAPGSYVVMVKMTILGFDGRAQLTATNYEVINLPDGTHSQEIDVGTPAQDEAILSGNSPPGDAIAVTLSAIVGIKIDARHLGKAECFCSARTAEVQNVMMVAIEVDDLTLIP